MQGAPPGWHHLRGRPRCPQPRAGAVRCAAAGGQKAQRAASSAAEPAGSSASGQGRGRQPLFYLFILTQIRRSMPVLVQEAG